MGRDGGGGVLCEVNSFPISEQCKSNHFYTCHNSYRYKIIFFGQPVCSVYVYTNYTILVLSSALKGVQYHNSGNFCGC